MTARSKDERCGQHNRVLSWTIVGLAAGTLLAGCGEDGSRGFVPTEPDEHPVKIIAHRGVNKFAPENTIPSIELAIEMGLDYVEIDVRTTEDGQMILMHDDTVDDTTDGTGRVKDLTAEEIKALDAGSWFAPEFAGTEVPFLEEAFAVMRGRIGAYVDVKDAEPPALVEAIRLGGMLADAVIYGDPFTLWAMVALASDILAMPEVGASRALLNLMEWLLSPQVVAVSWGDPSRGFIDLIHDHGALAFMDVLGEWDNPDGMRRAIALGVDAIQTDHPDVLLEVMEGE